MSTKLEIERLKERADAYIQKRNDFYPKEERLYTRQEVSDYLSINKVTLDNHVKNLGFNVKAREGMQWSMSISELYDFESLLPKNLQKNEHFHRKANQKCQVIMMQNQKGGVGKTVCAATVAACLSAEFPEKLRIGLVDLDGQSTLSMYYASNAQRDSEFSVGDIVRGNYSFEDGETFEKLVSDAFLPTTIPNLRILPALQSDRSLEGWFHRVHKDLDNPYGQVKKIVDAVKDEFDIIILDSPPSLSFMTYNGYFAATSIVFPLAANENDIDATCNYFANLPEVWALLENYEHKGYDFMRMLVTNYRQTVSNTSLMNQLNRSFGEWLYPTQFKHSEAVQLCTSMMNTVFDLTASEYPKAKKTLNDARTNAFEVASQIYRDVDNVWSINNG
ncbi:ParA family protein [Vibrio sp. 10N.261.51.A1]|uniref:Chromosome partitioning protein ParA n=1 Tax=Vibrio cyclitrophicus TaxID=47951 RepID=A0A7Z1S1E1_9VIBR|nr:MULTISPECIES: ParA family protein [Vibrio]PMK74293.1 chromosome partitioning protein ParA [Vibrio sp. 10N.261.52.E5]PMP17135.1 chromosome partitioning protein ParA [Vibrio cyclitrophicus]PMP26141.1 chromosome partitioning protein ParA [Vibrio cyclitrophicus]TKF84811.1 ParA family protein [Vibrio sp. F13]